MSSGLFPRIETRIASLSPPYEEFQPVDLSWTPSSLPPRGCALIWWLVSAEEQEAEFHWLFHRPPGLPLVVILPPASEIAATLPLLNYVAALDPRAVLPTARINSPARIRELLSAPPPQLATAVVEYLSRRDLLRGRVIRLEVQRIFEVAPEVSSISKLARRLYTSRRTLGRHFAAAGLPVPSHWLQAARLLHVCIRLQNEPAAVFRIASRAGYPDGFTMSNQMKRLFNCRPSEARRCVGWEWLVESWIQREVVHGSIDDKRYARSISWYLSQRGATSHLGGHTIIKQSSARSSNSGMGRSQAGWASAIGPSIADRPTSAAARSNEFRRNKV